MEIDTLDRYNRNKARRWVPPDAGQRGRVFGPNFIRKEKATAVAREYLKTWDKKATAEKFGHQSAHSLFDNESVKEAIAMELEENKAQNLVEVGEVVKGLREVVTAAMAADKFADVNRALELMGKYIGMFVEKSENKFEYASPFDSSTNPEQRNKDIERLVTIAQPLIKKANEQNPTDPAV